jgi:hypothetical protein
MRRALQVSILAIGLFAATPCVAAVYKCKAASGEVKYQQIPCEVSNEESTVKVHKAPPPSHHSPWVENANERQAAQWQGVGTTYDPSFPAQSAPARGSRDPEALRQLQNRQASLRETTGRSQVDAARRAELRREIADLQARLGVEESTYQDAAPAQRQTVPPVVRTGPGYTEPRIIRDQHGNQYSQPPGSSFATEMKTGKQCYVFGDMVRCD